MSIKDLFGKSSQKVLTAQDAQTLYDEAESEGYLEEIAIENSRFLPIVDFSSASNFARYGSAEKYYVDAIKNIYQRYPYDGSRKEKLQWRNNSSQFDLFVFDNIYPRTTGYVTLNSSSQQYVTVNGGPNTASSGKFEDNNIYDLSKNRESNLAINPLNLGNTVEFWYKSSGTNATTFAFFDLWNGAASGTSAYTRFLIEKKSTGFGLTYISGTAGVQNASIAYALDTANWHHYAISIASASAGLDVRLYVDGQFISSTVTGSAFSLMANNSGAVANIGAYRTGSSVYTNGSFDEFRFWKEARSSKNISRYWFTSVGGGSNTDDSNTELGVYFKFNEGIISTASVDALDIQCLDYSGRISNGRIINYTTAVRNTGSAINEFSNEFNEPADPILYPKNPLLEAVIEQYALSGSLYDEENNSNIYKSLPAWITEQQENAELDDLSHLVQIISSYFDTLHAQIENLPRLKDVKYYTDGNKPAPFTSKILTSYGFENIEIFNDTNFLEEILSRSETDEFEKSLTDIKNTIYQNIYNNLTYIYKSKGTEKAFRNLIRCFGIDDELIKVNTYSNNTEYEFSNKYQYVSTPKKFVDFNDPDRFEGMIYQKSLSDGNSRGYIKGNSSGALNYIPLTVQAEIIFPKKIENDNQNYSNPGTTTISLFGVHTANDNESILNWGNDTFNFQVFAEKRNVYSSDVYFKLSGSFSGSGFALTSSWYNDIYDNNKWNLAVRVKPIKLGNSNLVSGSSIGDYIIELVGNHSILDSVQDSFIISASIPEVNAKAALAVNKRVYAGAHYQNFNPSYLLQSSDVKISSVRYWLDYLTDDELIAHSFDAATYGRKHPNWNAYLLQTTASNLMLTKIDTLALNWDFNNVTSSDSNGQFLVEDASSGSAAYAQKYGYGWLGDIIKYRHAGFGAEFYPNDTQVINKEYVFSAKLQNPETVVGSDMIQIRVTDDITSTRNTKPISYYHLIEKSMSQVINDEILNWFATIDAYNNLIGQPLEKYQKQYKALTHLRQLFFDKVGNSPDFERFLEFFKWIDSSISLMIMQLIPASANITNNVRNVVESHLLERNKYENKLPTIEIKDDASIVTTNLIKYNYTDQKSSANGSGPLWLKLRVERTNPLVSSGDSNADANRETLRQVLINKNLNPFPKLYDKTTKQSYTGTKDFVRGFSNIGEFRMERAETPEGVIRPVTIANVLIDSQFHFASSSLTASGQIIQPLKKKGNYFHTYEYLQTTSRTNANVGFVDILDQLNAPSKITAISGVVERALPVRPVVKTVIVERFNSPGGVENTGRGALNIESEEMSAYNNTNTRNIVVRRQLNKWAAETGSWDSENPSYHKINKNTGYFLNGDGTANPQYDNEFIQHQIPRSDAQYAWITASLITKPSASGFFSAYDNLNIYNTGSAQFISASISGNAIIDFVGLNTNIQVSADTSSNTISDTGVTTDLNKYLLNIGGASGNASWRQIRNSYNKIVRLFRKNNKITVQDPPTLKVKIENGVKQTYIENKTQTATAYKEPPVVFNIPMQHEVGIQDSPTDLEIISTYDNNKEKFANEAMSKVLGVKDRQEPQTYDILNSLEDGAYEPKPEIHVIKYSENIYPAKKYITTADVRNRPVFDDSVGNVGSIVDARTFWRDDINNRVREDTTVDLFGFTTSSYADLNQAYEMSIYNGATFSSIGIDNTDNNLKKTIFSLDSYNSGTFSFREGFYDSTANQYITKLVNNGTSFIKIKNFGLSNTVFTIFSGSDAIYAGGYFADASGSYISKWNGSSWSPLAGGLSNTVFTIFSGSSGVYAGGLFAGASGSYISRWNGSSWNPLAGGLNGPVYSVFSGSDGVYAGGLFAGVSGSRVSKWNGTSWSPLAGGLNGGVRVIFSSSNGVYAGGDFTGASGSCISRWNGSSWSPLAGGLAGSVFTIFSGSDAIYAGGYFADASGSYISKWNGSSWSPLAGGLSDTVKIILSASDGIYAGGNFFDASGSCISRWNGSSWSPLEAGGLFGSPYTFFSGSDGLYVGGYFFAHITSKKNLTIEQKNGYLKSKNIIEEKYFEKNNIFYSLDNIAKYNTIEKNFYSLENKIIQSDNAKLNFDSTSYTPNYSISSFTSGSDGVYVGGTFKVSGSSLAKWHGSNWTPILYPYFGSGDVYALLSASDGLYYSTDDGLYKFDGTSFTQVFNPYILSIFSGSDGVYAGGLFAGASGSNISKWNGSSWSPLAGGLNGGVFSVFSGSDGVYAGGGFTGVSGSHVSKWNGTSWSPLAGGLNDTVLSIFSGSDGVYAGGYFTGASGSYISKWNGSSWNALGTPSAGLNGLVRAITSNSSGLYVGGDFISTTGYTNNIIVNNIAKWNGTSWEMVGRQSIRNGFNYDNSLNSVYSIFCDKDELFICGKFSGTRSGLLIKDKKYDYYFEAYEPKNTLLIPTPQLVFNNFIPPSNGFISGSQIIYENTYNTNNKLVTSSVYNNKESIGVLNEGYIYETDKISGNKPFYDSHEVFLSDLRPKSQKYGTVPEYCISDYVKTYVNKRNGNFNTIITTDYLKTPGALQSSGFQDINNSTNVSQQLNADVIFNKAKQIEKEVNLELKVSGIKKLLPYKGFYPSERVVTLSNYFINSFLKLSQSLQSTNNTRESFKYALSNGTPINQQILTLLQPLFAPGILLNTIKASIAVDYPSFITNSVEYSSLTPPDFYANTGSNLINTTVYDSLLNVYRQYTASSYINSEPNYRFPFESLIEFDTLIPESLKTDSNNLYYLNPSHYTSDILTASDYSTIAYPSYNMGQSGSLKAFVFLDSNYKLAMHNFLAEIPYFFLRGKLTNISSEPENNYKVAIAGKKYYMDVVLERSNDYKEFITDPFYESIKKNPFYHQNGYFMIPSTDSLYGPPVRYWNSVSASTLFAKGPYNLFSKLLDTPAYAPYVPPYYYGAAYARISFLADETRQYTLSEIQEKAQIEYFNKGATSLFNERSNILVDKYTDSQRIDNYSSSPAYKQMMAISASINLLLKSELKNRTFDASNSSPSTIQDNRDKVFSWVIQPKFETPSINFINSDLSENVGLKFVGGVKTSNSVSGIYKNLFKGMWTSYGEPIKDGSGIKLYIQESYPKTASAATGSLIDLCGFHKDEKKTIGLLANKKIVSEGVVVIPYTFNQNHGNKIDAKYASTLPELVGENGLINISGRGNGPYYFKIDRNTLKDLIGLSFAKESKVTFEEIKTAVNSNKVNQNNSIVKLVREMTNYVIPPHLDWLRNKDIEPFVMYIIPFETMLDQDDLSSIWQGVMPKPSLTAEMETHVINHPFSIDEMFHGKRLPNDIRYKLFKVKQKAHVNYYELTDDSKDDTRFKFKFGNSQDASIPDYSYNYPYDFFSLVELVNIESKLTYTSGSI